MADIYRYPATFEHSQHPFGSSELKLGMCGYFLGRLIDYRSEGKCLSNLRYDFIFFSQFLSFGTPLQPLQIC